jgi:DNA primase
MAGRIVKDDIDTLRERADIVAVVGDHTRLKKAGQRWKGLCPFHSEKSPSFTVDAATNLYYCFGCSEGGDIYDFLMKVEGLDFVEAVEQLARRTGFSLRYEEMSAREKRALGERSRMVAVTTAALEWFRAQLYAEQGRVARDYLKERGFGREDAERFALGFAPEAWDALSRHLTVEKGFSREDVLGTVLARTNDRGGLRDTFRGRLVFPVRDLSGDPIGFGGRVLPGIDYGNFDPPKYLNSPEYRLYHKHKVLYGLHEARPEVVRTEEVLICEGYTDVMALHQAGYANAVATCGTAVGPDHFRMLARYARRVVLAFDSDAAGVKAAQRAWEAAREVEAELNGQQALKPGETHHFSLRVLVLPDGRDPADHVREAGVDGLRTAIADAPDVVPFLVRNTIAQADTSTEEGRISAMREALLLLGDETDPDLRRVYARREVADALGVSPEFVTRSAARLGVQVDAHTGVATVGRRTGHAGGGVVRADVTRARTQRERAVLRVALQHPEMLPAEWGELTGADFTHPSARALYGAIVDAGGAGAAVDAVLAACPDDEVRGVVQRVAFEEPDVADSPAATSQRLRGMLADRLEAQVRAAREELERTSMTTDAARVIELTRLLADLEQRRRSLTTFDVDAGDPAV